MPLFTSPLPPAAVLVPHISPSSNAAQERVRRVPLRTARHLRLFHIVCKLSDKAALERSLVVLRDVERRLDVEEELVFEYVIWSLHRPVCGRGTWLVPDQV